MVSLRAFVGVWGLWEFVATVAPLVVLGLREVVAVVVLVSVWAYDRLEPLLSLWVLFRLPDVVAFVGVLGLCGPYGCFGPLKCYYDQNRIFPIKAILKHK